jgi:hypothetical protein
MLGAFYSSGEVDPLSSSAKMALCRSVGNRCETLPVLKGALAHPDLGSAPSRAGLFPFSWDFHYNRRGNNEIDQARALGATRSWQAQEVKPDIRWLRIAAWVMTR